MSNGHKAAQDLLLVFVPIRTPLSWAPTCYDIAHTCPSVQYPSSLLHANFSR